MEFIFLTLLILKGWLNSFMTHSSMSQDYLKMKNYSHQQRWEKKSTCNSQSIYWCQLLPCSWDHLGVSHKVTLTLGAQGLRWKQGCMLSWVLPFCSLKEHIFHVIILNSQDRWRSYLNRLMILPTILTLLHQYFPQQNSCALCIGCTIKTKDGI